jgi:hypothetical protein
VGRLTSEAVRGDLRLPSFANVTAPCGLTFHSDFWIASSASPSRLSQHTSQHLFARTHVCHKRSQGRFCPSSTVTGKYCHTHVPGFCCPQSLRRNSSWEHPRKSPPTAFCHLDTTSCTPTYHKQHTKLAPRPVANSRYFPVTVPTAPTARTAVRCIQLQRVRDPSHERCLPREQEHRRCPPGTGAHTGGSKESAGVEGWSIFRLPA